MRAKRIGPCGAASIAPLVLAATAAGQPAFTDVTSDAGVIATHQPSTFFLLSQFDLSPMTAGGLAGDFNNDGWQDLYVILSGSEPDRLFINDGKGAFTDQAESWGVAYAHMGLGGAVGDYNGDGWLDIYLTSLGPGVAAPDSGHHILYRNNGDNTFTDVAEDMGVQWTSTDYPDGFGAAFGDYDLDGDLDLAVVGWIPSGDQNKLFRNDGTHFTDVTDSADLDGISSCRGFSPAFADMNGDRYPELLIAADFGTSQYFINDGDGTFTNYTSESGTGLDGNGMGHFVADLNNDGLFDWYVTSIYSPNSGLPNVPGTGNMLYMNQGGHVYAETSIDADINDGGWGWGTVPVDLDHDGLLDIVETNGWAQRNYGQPEWQNERTYVWVQGDEQSFEDVSQICGVTHDLYGRGLLNFDYDNDGDQDIAIFSLNESMQLYRNDHDAENTSWLRVFLDTSSDDALAPNGFGSTVVATVNGQSQYRMIVGGSHYLSHSELSAHFGLGDTEVIDELRVEWNDGTVTVLEDVAVDQAIIVEPGSAVEGDANGDGAVNVQDLIAVLTNWGTDDADADLNGDGIVNVLDLVLVVTNWS